MTKERLKAITELAQSIPEWAAMVQLPNEKMCIVPERHGASVRIVDPSGDLTLLAIRLHPKAFEALEAALLVLANRHMDASEADIAAGTAAIERTYQYGGGTDEAAARAAIEAAYERRLKP